jgi:hypothetical protein
MANINSLVQQRDEMYHLGSQIGSLKTLVRDALVALEKGRYSMPLTLDREEVDQKLERFYERLNEITQRDTEFLEKKWQTREQKPRPIPSGSTVCGLSSPSH